MHTHNQIAIISLTRGPAGCRSWSTRAPPGAPRAPPSSASGPAYNDNNNSIMIIISSSSSSSSSGSIVIVIIIILQITMAISAARILPAEPPSYNINYYTMLHYNVA